VRLLGTSVPDAAFKITSPNSESVCAMSDDKSNRSGHDRSRVAGGEGYEVSYFARKHGISRQEAEDLIKRIGNDRERLDEAAAALKR
ncbi:MAG TPA: DUF3606 domain-containing protein, partial [Sphingomicrobium sp.]|nr:DUF3606 domain-containing protein [Sphingomicrobium sp.]